MEFATSQAPRHWTFRSIYGAARAGDNGRMKTELAGFEVAKSIQIIGGVPGVGPGFDRSPKSVSRAPLLVEVTGSSGAKTKPGPRARAFETTRGVKLGTARGMVCAPRVAPSAPRRLVLRGDPALLRRLRAAEMAAWQASSPV